MPSDWSEANPWNACLRALATDEDYWSEQGRHPAAAWTAFGGRGTPMAPSEQAALVHAPGGQNIELEPEARTDDRRKQSNRDRRAAKVRRIRAGREELVFPQTWKGF